MAFLSKVLVFTTALVSLAAAAPLNLPRDPVSVVTETAYVTVDVPVTLWVDENGKPIKTEVPAQGGQFAAQTGAPNLQSSALPSTTTSSVPIPAPTLPATTVAAVVPITTPAPPVISSTTPIPTTQVPVPSSPPAISSAPAPVATATNRPSGASSTGTCEGTGNACSGDITYYEGGLGACGWNVNTASDMSIALPHDFMGTQSNGNPYCGRSVTILNPTTGNTIQAKVGDKCMGCTGRSIDLTDAAFKAVGAGCDGRCPGFEWWLN